MFNEKSGLEKILQEGYNDDIYFITDQDSRPLGSAHPRAHLWDNSYDAADELNRMLDLTSASSLYLFLKFSHYYTASMLYFQKFHRGTGRN